MSDNRDDTQSVKAMDYRITADGRTIALRFHRADKSTADLQLDYELLGWLIRSMEEAMRRAYHQQQTYLKGTDPRLMYPVNARQVTEVGGGYAIDGRVVVTFAFTTGSRMDIAMDEAVLRQLTRQLIDLQENNPRENPPRVS